jgi:hypothetical protein
MENLQPSSSASPHDHNIDPAIAGSGMMNTSAESGDDVGADGRKGGKRELSTSKRAAQNRAAQVGFAICDAIDEMKSWFFEVVRFVFVLYSHRTQLT